MKKFSILLSLSLLAALFAAPAFTGEEHPTAQPMADVATEPQCAQPSADLDLLSLMASTEPGLDDQDEPYLGGGWGPCSAGRTCTPGTTCCKDTVTGGLTKTCGTGGVWEKNATACPAGNGCQGSGPGSSCLP